MTRKFNKPPCYPWGYDTPSGKATVCAPMPDGLGWVGFITHVDGAEIGAVWNDNGEHSEHEDGDLCDVPKRGFGRVVSGGIKFYIEYDTDTGANATIVKVE